LRLLQRVFRWEVLERLGKVSYSFYLFHGLVIIIFCNHLGPLLQELPKRERAILVMRFFGGLTQTQIADRIGISQMHVSRLLSQTLEQLRGKLTGEG